jgi:hypothetical protein
VYSDLVVIQMYKGIVRPGRGFASTEKDSMKSALSGDPRARGKQCKKLTSV